ncbi:hypothetical protein EUGRSUZ_C03115 [Eucalyptus grandis]|uniref:Uncharacterized protein n=2 Tax=Eucalyptus grandis TaxID=71139 RepID=A0ACC3LHH6_EUCGR|nr:hypothetical protein EUGRSUZ_C03115 [Eucalyptus grandis]
MVKLKLRIHPEVYYFYIYLVFHDLSKDPKYLHKQVKWMTCLVVVLHDLLIFYSICDSYGFRPPSIHRGAICRGLINVNHVISYIRRIYQNQRTLINQAQYPPG